MVKINDNFKLIPPTYLFSEVAKKIKAYKDANISKEVILMGIGDVTRPICPAVIDAMHSAVDDMSKSDTFHGYGPEQGYDFLREKIASFDYQRRGIDIKASEIFVSDGAKSDTGNIGDIFNINNKVAVTDPVYPVYIDTNAMAGRAGTFEAGQWSRIEYLPCTEANKFVPSLPTTHVDMIYLCYPNNPTGTTLTKAQLERWVKYAKQEGSIILFDSAYEAYITENDVPHSIYEIAGAKEVAIEFRSFSKTAGFTGIRCGYTVIPEELTGISSNGEKVSVRQLWNRRQCTKFNGASYISQRAAEAIYSESGALQVKETISYYMRNAKLLLMGLENVGIKAYGGINAPYVWIKTPDGMTSWEFFDFLLEKFQIVGTPGVGFGNSGEGFFRLTAFNSYENTLKAVERLSKI